ncbi:feruloyl esterase [Aspergillus ellipticus CBS 707.79]|uniref:Carboxylic ester hydrolase n=1 Tax=Aspergillus ellipticus CBS 707.79 TaxID=1448320 RepID=A0A319DBC3_9EURO|nr:feruloyl esterase [Aspergillus ellipticus CBS 707.79]
MQLLLASHVLPWLSSLWSPQSQAQLQPTACDSLSLPSIPGIKILSLTSHEVTHYHPPSTPDTDSIPLINTTSTTTPPDLSFCNVTIHLTHSPSDHDTVYISLWLPPASAWNGRFQATGGGGLAAGYFPGPQVSALVEGYATGATDGGLTLNNTIEPQTGSWALRPNGTLNTALLTNYAHRSIHDLAVIGKTLTAQFYGRPANHSYFKGCSTGGRQGYFAAALYPNDFDGIVAGAPAIHLPHLFSELFWPPLLMTHSVVPRGCVLEAFRKKLVEVCDPLDGAVDGLISGYWPKKCVQGFQAGGLVGSVVECAEGNRTEKVVVTDAHAQLVQRILDGPRLGDGRKLWHAMAPGASFKGTAGTAVVNGSVVVQPFFPVIGWAKNFVFQDPAYDVMGMGFEDFDEAALVSIEKFQGLLGSEQHYLGEFRDAGGKMLSWHGLADELIPPLGTIGYREGVQEDFGGPEAADQFYRLFLAPGVGHCGGGDGPAPVDALAALVRWVEEGVPPETLAAEGVDGKGEKVTRALCPYPAQLVYDGHGDVKKAGSFRCEVLTDE